jgi:hypothetical protein
VGIQFCGTPCNYRGENPNADFGTPTTAMKFAFAFVLLAVETFMMDVLFSCQWDD